MNRTTRVLQQRLDNVAARNQEREDRWRRRRRQPWTREFWRPQSTRPATEAVELSAGTYLITYPVNLLPGNVLTGEDAR